MNICSTLVPWGGGAETNTAGHAPNLQRPAPCRPPTAPTWFPPLLGLTKTSTGFMSGEGRGLSRNGRHLDSCGAENG